MSICQGYFVPTIYKLLWHQLDENNTIITYIFVGYCKKDIIDILKKIEISGYSELTQLQITTLNKVFPNYEKLFGDIKNGGHTIFMYNLIDDSDCIIHIMEDIHHYLKINVKNIYLWYNSRTITNDYFNQQINFIFDDNHSSIKNDIFIKKLLQLSSSNSLDELKHKLLEQLPNKYKSISQIKYFDRDQYYINTEIINDDLRALLVSLPITLTNKYYYISGDKKIAILNYIDPLVAISNKYTNSDINISHYIDGHNTQYYKQLQTYGRLLNNEIHMICKNDNIMSKLPYKLLHFYFPMENYHQLANIIALRQSIILNYPSNLRKVIDTNIFFEKDIL